MKNLAAVMALSLAGVSAANATVHDHIFANRFDTITDLPANANEAARFLTQATFGPTTAGRMDSGPALKRRVPE